VHRAARAGPQAAIAPASEIPAIPACAVSVTSLPDGRKLAWHEPLHASDSALLSDTLPFPVTLTASGGDGALAADEDAR
jgi:hypothetical protein